MAYANAALTPRHRLTGARLGEDGWPIGEVVGPAQSSLEPGGPSVG